MKKFTFLIPVFNDWDSLNILLERIDQEISSFEDIFDIVVLNDDSTIKHSIKNKNFKKINLIKVLNLILIIILIIFLLMVIKSKLIELFLICLKILLKA